MAHVVRYWDKCAALWNPTPNIMVPMISWFCRYETEANEAVTPWIPTFPSMPNMYRTHLELLILAAACLKRTRIGFSLEKAIYRHCNNVQFCASKLHPKSWEAGENFEANQRGTKVRQRPFGLLAVKYSDMYKRCIEVGLRKW